MGCAYCKNKDESIDVIRINKDKYDSRYYLSFETEYDYDLYGFNRAKIRINNCPWCGVELGE